MDVGTSQRCDDVNGMVSPTVRLFARYPTPGAAKTRLIPALGEDGAARLHRRLVERTIEVVRDAELPLVVHTTGGTAAHFADWLPGVSCVDQGAGDLGERLARVPAPALLLGADIPDLSTGHLQAAVDALAQVPVVIGPAVDGGYYLLGFRAPVPFLFDAMPWGTDAVRAETERRLTERRVPYRLLDPLHDCDRPADLARWPELAA